MPRFDPPAILVRRNPAASAPHRSPDQLPRDDGVQRRSVAVANIHIYMEYRPDVRSRLVLFEGWWLYLSTPVGWDVYVELGELLVQAPTLGPERTLDRLEHLRLTTFIACDERSGALYFGRSLDGFCSMFFGGNATQLVISDSRLAVAKTLGKIQLSKDDELNWLNGFQLPPERSFFENTRRCFAGVRYTSGPRQATTNPSRHLMASVADLAHPSEALTLFHDDLMRTFATYRNKVIALRLSGGLDSRTLLAGLLQAVREGVLRSEQIICVSVLFPGMSCDESDIIRSLIAHTNFRWHGIEATPPIARRAYERCLRLPAPPFPTNFMRELCLSQARKSDADLVLSGHGGDELFSFNLTDLLSTPLPMRLAHLGSIRRLRRPRGLIDECKALALGCLGHRVDRTIRRMLHAHGLDRYLASTHRLGRRTTLASACGYEVPPSTTYAPELLIDAPLLRSCLWSRYSPTSDNHSAGFNCKALARRYLEVYAPDFGKIPSKKALFSVAIKLQFPPELSEPISVNSRSIYFQSQIFSDWASRILIGVKQNEQYH